jgi:hypothetical protein
MISMAIIYSIIIRNSLIAGGAMQERKIGEI